MKFEERFWSDVKKSEPEECWPWTAGSNSDGYGTVSINGEVRMAHRVSYTLEHSAPGDQWVLHTCDNPSCVNPNHLYLGSPSDNLQDAWDRDRREADGEANPNSKLTELEVLDIRGRADEEKHGDLADEFGVSISTVHMIASGRRWTDE